uniref:Uncharacterized protein n=1 Tax=Physcomitrium patens TaxID=3218 RepID=A0A2K1KPG2_PHYPA|nr:hypothetical protein PHYPA_006557 [Physcomitrium patens]
MTNITSLTYFSRYNVIRSFNNT